jgi:predicted transcriptional regulator YheO
MKVDLIKTLDKIYGLQSKSDNRKSTTNSVTEKANEKTVKADSLEISSDLRKIQLIKSKYESGYYNNQDVIQEIAKRLIVHSEL